MRDDTLVLMQTVDFPCSFSLKMDYQTEKKPLRMALGAFIIQQKFQFSDRELVEQITENPYLQLSVIHRTSPF